MVVFFHATMFRPFSEFGFFLGRAGVDFFFMISGFVILLSAEKKASPKRFVISRFIRIYPIYWVIATFTFLSYLILNYFNTPAPYVELPFYDYVVNLTMIQYFFNVPNIDGSYWTLIIELLFYVFIYILLRLKVLKKIVLIGAVFCAVSFVLFWLISNEMIPDFTKLFPLLYHFPLFYVGLLFYKIFLNNKLYLKYLPLILLCLALQVYLHNYSNATLFMSVEWYAFMLAMGFVIFTLFVFGKMGWITNKVTLFFGDISYTLYLVHQPLTYGFLIPLMVDELGFNFWVVTLCVSTPIAIGFATIFTYKVDNPLRKYLLKKM